MKRRIRYSTAVLVLVFLSVTVFCVGGAPIELSYMSWYTGESDALEQDVIARFNALHPDVKVVKIGGDPRQKLLTMIAGGAPPDISVINGVTQPTT